MTNNGRLKKYRHAPPHLFEAGAIYMITARIYRGLPIMKNAARKEDWISAFLTAADIYRWRTIAWVVLDNHYHGLLQAPEDGAESLPAFVASFHKFNARRWNVEDNTPGRRVWCNYWDTCIWSPRGFYIRLNYIFNNPVKHGLAQTAEEYRFSSFNWAGENS
ncbi:MAG: hypothetical protein R3335_10155 [Anaerolineales bacterium]|nr:hypothetical protein [Anaerolineales bacterium]